jgi:hypothetical protein
MANDCFISTQCALIIAKVRFARGIAHALGCISKKFRLGRSKPRCIEGVVKNGGTNNEPALGGIATPAHSRPR